MLDIRVQMTGALAGKAYFDGLGKQVAYAASRAINTTGKIVADAMRDEVAKHIDRPTPFTRQGVAVLRYSSKTSLTAEVGYRPLQAAYMKYQIAGGVREPGRLGLKLPGNIVLNEFGNIPRGEIAKLKQAAQNGSLSRAIGKRLGVDSKRKNAAPIELYFGKPRGKRWEKSPIGIWRRVRGNPGALVPVILFPQRAAHYKPRFAFGAIAARLVSESWPIEFDKALVEALRTAK